MVKNEGLAQILEVNEPENDERVPGKDPLYL